MLQIILYAVLCVLVALLGVGKRGGFLLHLAVSIALTPVAGIVVALIAPAAKVEGKKPK